jgi:hypothetical protein
MKNLITRAFTLISGLLYTSAFTGQNNSGIATETFTVSGNCGMCKKTIENAAAIKGVKTAQWSETTKMLTLKYDRAKTTPADVLRKVAYAGYDNEKYLAPEKAYKSLHGCCQYEREIKKEKQSNSHASHQKQYQQSGNKPAQQKKSGVDKVYDSYFVAKDALVKSDAGNAATAAAQILDAVEAVDMSAMSEKEHETYMKLEKDLKEHAKGIANNKNIEKQRKSFSALSETMYKMMKALNPEYEVYLDHCPMYDDGKGGNWLSKGKPIRNPYYGSKMMTCGNVQETLK